MLPYHGFILGDLLLKLYRIDKKVGQFIVEERTQLIDSLKLERALMELLGIEKEEVK